MTVNADTHFQTRLPKWLKSYFVKAAQKEHAKNKTKERGLSNWVLSHCKQQASEILGITPEEFKEEWIRRQIVKEEKGR